MSEAVGCKPVFADCDDDQSHVEVVIRLRPPEDRAEDVTEIYRARGNTLTIRDPLSRGCNERNYYFNHIFMPEHGQQYVFEGVALPLIDRLLAGFNSCCFAYGQTGSGKTHSIFGEGAADQRGVLARSLECLFERIERRSSHKEVGMVVSFTEIYLDQVRDLGRFYTLKKNGVQLDDSVRHDASSGADHLRRSSSKDPPDAYLSQDLAIHESPAGHVYVEDLTVIPVSSLREVLDIVNLGVRMRATYETKLNARSSRSHTIFTVSIVQKSRQSEDIVNSCINFVDLAGSERLARSKSEGRRFQEAVVINSSLSALGKVVLALASDPKTVRHVPYRDSKLTRILQNSLGGNSYTTLLTTIDPSAINYEESLNSLSFADRCKNVQNKPVIGHIEAQQESHEQVIKRLTAEIAQLKLQLETLNVGLASMKRASDLAAEEAKQRQSLDLTVPKSKDVPRLDDLAKSAAGATAQKPEDKSQVPSSTSSSRVAPPVPGSHDEASAAKAAQEPEEMDEELLQIQQQAELRLEQEREQTSRAELEADQALTRLEQARQEMAQREQKRRQEDAELKRRNQELEIEIAKCKSSLRNVADRIAAEQMKERQLVKDNTDEVVRSRQDMLRGVPPEFACEKTDSMIEAATDKYGADKTREAEAQRLQTMLEVQQSYDRDMKSLETQQSHFMREKEAVAQHVAMEMEGCQTRHERWQRQMRGELMDAYSLVCELGKVIDSLQSGIPSQLKSDIQAPPLQLGGLRARLKKEKVLPDRIFEQFSQGVSELWRRLGKYNQLLHQSSQEKAVGSTVKLNQVLSTSGRPPLQEKAGGDGGGYPPTYLAGPTVSSDSALSWDADAFARDFCDFREGASATDSSAAQVTLQRLDAHRLKALCRSLRKRVCMSAEEQETERARLRNELAQNLAVHDRVHQIRKLEKDIAEYQVKFVYEDGRTRHLESVLQARSGHSSGSNSRLASRPGSRPASAGPGGGTTSFGRPTSAGRRVPRPFSAGPGRP